MALLYWQYRNNFYLQQGNNSLNTFIEELNLFLPNLKFTSEISKEKVALLGLSVKKMLWFPPSKFIIKHTSKNLQYYKQKSLNYSQTQRLNNICSNIKDLNKSLWDMKPSSFLDKGYSEEIIDLQIGKVRFG